MEVVPAEGYVPLDPNSAHGLLVQRFEQIVAAAPKRVAVVTDTQTLTLAQLNGQANAIARRLLRPDFPPNTLIALTMAHGSEKVAAAIGVLKAAAAYVSIHPMLADQGIRDLCLHAEASIVLTDTENFDRTRRLAPPSAAVVDVATLVSDPVVDNPDCPVSTNTYYAIHYTSGSTGKPKGVIHTHGTEFNTVLSVATGRKFGPGDRIAFMQGFWTSSLFGALISGATLHPFDLSREGLGAMKAWLLRHRITCYHGILTGFRQFLTTLQPDDFFPDMRVISVAGEPLLRADVVRVDGAFPSTCSLMNQYGATEQPSMTEFSVDRVALPSDGDILPVGFPAPYTDVELVDEKFAPVDRGTVGELVVRGTELSPGYWRDPALSARIWPPDPAAPGQRLFRTGDLAVMDDDGCLHGRGRADQQVKIRGHRVVADEIENMLVEHPAIRAAVVVRDQVKAGHDRLVGYIVGQTDSVPTTSELRGYLGRRLPDYMVPALFMPVTGFDLTSTGKVDRRALPPPEIDIHARSGDVVAPANEVEVVIKEIWEHLLGEQGLSVEDDFFLIGGDSVLAMTMFLQMEQRLERQLPFEGLWLQGSTIRALAKTVSDGVPEMNWGQALPLQTNGDKPALFVVSQREMPIFCLSLIPYFGSDQPVYGLPARGIGGDTLPDRRIEDMAAHCIEMMRRVQPHGPYRIMGHSAAGLVAFEIAQILGRQGTDVSKLVLLDSDMPGSAGKLAGKVLRQPLKGVRFAGSLIGQALGLSASAGSVARQAAKSSAYFRYRPKPYSGGAILVVASERQNTAELARGWRRLVKGDLVVAEVSGDHISMMQEPGIGELARTLMRQLED